MRHLYLLLFGMLPLLSYHQVPEYVPTDGLVAWYPFNGNANDESGHGHHGVILGATLNNDQLGVDSAAIYFDGDAFITIENHPDFNVQSLTMCITYQDFDNPAAIPNGNSIFVSKRPGTGWGGSFEFGTGGPDHEFNASNSINGNQSLLFGQDELGEWKSVCYVHDINSIKVYFDGVILDSLDSPGLFAPSSEDVTIGRRGNGWHAFIGTISELAIWNRALIKDEISAFQNAQHVFGCSDSAACNFNEHASLDDGSCIYPPLGLTDCEIGSALCGEGTVWDASLQTCVGLDNCPADLNGNGLVDVSDLLLVLPEFGNECPPDMAEWTCGAPVNFHGYDYSTALIGEHCWFAENLRTEHYANGDVIPGGLSGSEWSNTSSTLVGAQAVYGEGNSYCDGNCDEVQNLAYFGRLYNWYAVIDSRGLCPSGWHVPTDGDWMTLEMELGMSESEAISTGWRGTNQGAQLKSSSSDAQSWNGTNSSGFSGLPGGVRTDDGFGEIENSSYLWSSSLDGNSNAWYRILNSSFQNVARSNFGWPLYGLSVRCVLDE